MRVETGPGCLQGESELLIEVICKSIGTLRPSYLARFFYNYM